MYLSLFSSCFVDLYLVIFIFSTYFFMLFYFFPALLKNVFFNLDFPAT